MRTTLALVILAIVVIIFFSDVIVGDRALLTYNPALDDPWQYYADQDQLGARSYRPDAVLSYLPRRVELSRSIKDGRFPLWNPYVLCGTPFFADPQSRVLYPISLLLVPFDPLRAMGYDVAIHVLLAMAGMYFFIKIVGSSTPGAMLAALSYGFSSFFFTRIGHPTFVASASWIPFLFYGFELARTKGRTGTILLTAFLVMGCLAGFPQIFLFGVMALVLYAALGGLEGVIRKDTYEAARSAKILAIAGSISGLVVCVQLIPFGEFARNSVGLGYDFETMKNIHLWHPVFLIRAIIPNFFGNPVDGTSWLILLKQGVSHENLGFFAYCGVGSFLLVCGSLVFMTTSRHVRALLLILVVSIGLGTCPVFLRAAYKILPFIRYSQIDRVSVLTCFAMSALAGITFSLASRTREASARKRFAIIVAVSIVILLGAFMTFIAMRETAANAFLNEASRFHSGTWDKPGYSNVGRWIDANAKSWLAFEMREVGRAALYLAVSGVALLLVALRRRGTLWHAGLPGLVLVLCLLFDVTLSARDYYVSQPADVLSETEGITFLREMPGRPGQWRTSRYPPKSRVLMPNTGQIFCIPSLGARSTMTPDARSAFWQIVSGSEGSGRLALRNVGIHMGEAYRLACARYVLSSRSEPLISSTDYSVVYDKDMRIYENRSALEKGICLRRSAIAEVEVAGRNVLGVYHALTRPEIERCGTVRIEVYEPEEIHLAADADEPCLLVFQDTFYPGWKAYVDNEQQEILRTDIGFRAIELDQGEHTILMVYRPTSLYIGMFITCVGILLGALYAWKGKYDARPTLHAGVKSNGRTAAG